MDSQDIKFIESWNVIIERILRLEKTFEDIGEVSIGRHYHRIYGAHVETIWVVVDGGNFEVGVYPFGGSVTFGVQIYKDGLPVRFYRETCIPLPERHSAYLAKSIRWTVCRVIERVRKRLA